MRTSRNTRFFEECDDIYKVDQFPVNIILRVQQCVTVSCYRKTFFPFA